jgi:hypothetical protein
MRRVHTAAPGLLVPIAQRCATGDGSVDVKAYTGATDTGAVLSCLADRAEAAVARLTVAQQMQSEIEEERRKIGDLKLIVGNRTL